MDFMKQHAEQQHNYAIDYMTQAETVKVNTQNQIWEAEKRSLLEQLYELENPKAPKRLH